MHAWKGPAGFLLLSIACVGAAIASAFTVWIALAVPALAAGAATAAFRNPPAGAPGMPTMPGDAPAEPIHAASTGLRWGAMLIGLVAASLLAWLTIKAFQGVIGDDHAPAFADRFLGVALGLAAATLCVGSGRAVRA